MEFRIANYMALYYFTEHDGSFCMQLSVLKIEIVWFIWTMLCGAQLSTD